jgi:hypothetical protein
VQPRVWDSSIAARPAPIVEDHQGRSTTARFRLRLPLCPASGTHSMALDEAILEATVSGERRMMASLALQHLRTLRGRTPSRPSTPFAPFGDATRGREPRPDGARRPPGTAQRPAAERRDRPPHRPGVLREGRCPLWAGVSCWEGRWRVLDRCPGGSPVPTYLLLDILSSFTVAGRPDITARSDPSGNGVLLASTAGHTKHACRVRHRRCGRRSSRTLCL